MKSPQMLTWSPGGGAVWKGYRAFREWSQAGGRASLGGGLLGSIVWSHFLFFVWKRCACSASSLPGHPHSHATIPSLL